MELIKNKKGIFFTAIVVVLLSLFFVAFTFFSAATERRTVQDRVETLDNFVFALEKDISRQVSISGFRSILAIEGYITQQGQFINDSEEAILEALYNGTISNETINLMEGFKITDWNDRIQNLSNKIGATSNYTILNLSVSQTDPWNVRIILTINITIADKGNLASWSSVKAIPSFVPIEEFEDPLYLINSGGLISNKFTKSHYTSFVNNSNVTNLLNHTLDSLYIASSSAPSFLKRLEGDLSSDPNGVESLVNIDKLSEQGISTEQKSVVDYIYFSVDNPSFSQVSGMPSWFRLDSAHLEVYEVSNITI